MYIQSMISKVKSLFRKDDVDDKGYINNYEVLPIQIREFFDVSLIGPWGMRIEEKGGTLVTFFAADRLKSFFSYAYINEHGTETTVLERPYDAIPDIQPPPQVPHPPPEIILVNNKIIFRFMKSPIPYFHKDKPATPTRP